ncbi:tagaturonate reductase [Parabacteroides sp. OttesenSCG-928-G06]|nr:tagaturonate reductase [Parabacteroides sp. OttesenSCG-928-G06]
MKELNKETAPKASYPERIIQFGEGNFLRAFADWMIKIMNDKTGFNSSVVVVQPIENGMAEMLNKQDCLYHVNLQGLEKGVEVNTLTLVDVISRALNPYTDFNAYLALAEQPEMRFVISNTTEAGIVFDPACKLDDAPASSYPGKLTQLLYHRFKTFGGDKDKGLIIFPCELIFLNGHKLKETIYQYIEHWNLGAAFKTWFTESCGVYATLVDRIVPGFPRKEIDTIKEKLQYNDNLVVQAEVFHLWVIEAPESISEEFPADKAGLNVLFVPSEEPYHERKVTLLNGPHTVLSPVAWLSGINIVRDACQHEVIGKYIHKVMFEELLETLDLPREELIAYGKDVLERFNNPYVDHAVESIMLNSFPKYQTRDLPGLKTYLTRKGELPKGLVLGLAAIITYYKGDTRIDGRVATPNDAQEIMQLLRDLWATGSTQKVAEGVLAAQSIWGEDLNNIPGLCEQVEYFLNAISEKGIFQVVKEII